MKNTIIFIVFIIMTAFFVGCGSDSSVSSSLGPQASITNAWSSLDNNDYSIAQQQFSEIISANNDYLDEAKIGLAFAYISDNMSNSIDAQNKIDQANTLIEEVFNYSSSTVYQSIENKIVTNADARAMLAVTYYLKGNDSKFNENLNLAKASGDLNSDTQSIIDSLSNI